MFKVVLDWIIVLYAYVMVAPCSMKGFLNIRFEEYRFILSPSIRLSHVLATLFTDGSGLSKKV